MADLMIVEGANTTEQIKSIDGLINGLNKALKAKTPDERLAEEVSKVKQTLTALMDHMGLVCESGPKLVIKRVRLLEEPADETDPDNPL